MPKGAIYDSGDECKFSHFIPKFTPQLCLVARGLTYKQASSILSFFQAKKSAERFEKSCNQVQQAVSDLDAQGYYPSTWRVEVLLGKPGLCREKIIYAAWKEALQECDFSHSLSAAGGKVCPQKPAFTLDSMTPKA